MAILINAIKMLDYTAIHLGRLTAKDTNSNVDLRSAAIFGKEVIKCTNTTYMIVAYHIIL